MQSLTLYYFPFSSCSRKVLFSLYEKDVTFQKVIISLPNGEQKSPDFLKKNPLGKVPVLQYGNDYLADSAVIMEFLEDHFPTPALLPSDTLHKARIRKATQYADQFFYPAISAILAHFRKPANEINRPEIELLFLDFKDAHLPVLTDLLNKGKTFLFGAVSLADIAFAFGLIRLKEMMGKTFTVEPAIERWMHRFQQLDSYKKICMLDNTI